jgi:hypothetical protein
MFKNKTENSSKLSFILYEQESAPKYFEVSKRYLQALIVGLPLISLISIISVMGLLIYFKNIKHSLQLREPKIIEALKKENDVLKKEKSAFLIQNTNLQKKLLTREDSYLDSLDLFKNIPGQIDQTGKNELIVENPVIRHGKDKKIQLDFNLTNNTKNKERVSGYVFVLLKEKGLLQYYPSDSIPENQSQIFFNKGEFFATSRFRPFKATFYSPQSLKDLTFKIIVFSNTGDLILRKVISSKLEN